MALIQSRCEDNYLTFDDIEHEYILNGELVPGATDVKVAYPEAFNLKQWRVGVGAQYVLDQLTDESDGKRYSKGEIWPLNKTKVKELITGAKNATKKILDDSADIGTLTHDYCFAKRTGIEFDFKRITNNEEIVRKRFKEVDIWCAEREKTETVLSAEEIVASPLHKFAGKYDVLVKIKKTGKIRLQDYKSSKGFYIEQFLQAGGYRQAIKEWQGLDVSELEIIRFNDNTEKPDSLVLSDDIEEFTQQFILCRNTRLFQRKWDKFFTVLYRKKK